MLKQFVKPLVALTRLAGLHTRACLMVGTMSASVCGISSAHAEQKSITLFTHGDTVLLTQGKDGVLTGRALTLFTCATQQAGYSFDISNAPLSRATIILNEIDNAVWFPAAYEGAQAPLSRSIGPAGDLEILWFQLKSSDHAPNSDTFKANATVTTYKGSAMESMLKAEGYQLIEGSADRKRLVYMVLTGTVDALLAVDFRNRLPADTRQKLEDAVKLTVRERIPVGFQISAPFATRAPQVVSALRKAFNDCRAQ